MNFSALSADCKAVRSDILLRCFPLTIGKYEHFFCLFQQHIVLDDFPIDVAPLGLYALTL